MTIETYQAPEPTRPAKTNIAKALTIAYWLFPPALLWEAAKFISNFLLGNFVGLIVLEGQTLIAKNIELTIDEEKSEWNSYIRITNGSASKHGDWDNKLTYKNSTVITHDQAELDTITIKPKHITSIEQQRYIIYFHANAECYQIFIDEFQQIAQDTHCTVVGFNYRNVASSSKKSVNKQDNLVTDGIAQVQCLLDQGVLPENIILNGRSLGGAVATLVTKHFHDLKKPVYLFNDRSFSSITNIVVGWLRTSGRNGHNETFIGKLMGWLAWPFIKTTLTLTNWDMDVAEAYKAIPETHKDYMLIRSSKSLRNTWGAGLIDDSMITHYASLHQAIKIKPLERQQEKKLLKKQIASLSKNAEERTPEQTTKLNEAETQLEQLKALSNRHKFSADFYLNGHNRPMMELKNRLNNNGYQFFKDFVVGKFYKLSASNNSNKL